MFPPRRIIRFFLVYGAALFFMDQLLISPSRSVMESLAIVLAADLIAIVLYALILKLTGKSGGKNHETDA